jgi:sulfopyruvate decarboxylase TPP-binding subunit
MRVGSIVMETANPVVARPWHEIVQQTLKRNHVKLVTYVPDKVFTPLIKSLHADPDFFTFPTAREEEARGSAPLTATRCRSASAS